ncbi:MAG: cobyrinate a,c-diamide synthase [Spirochaetales bacterium]|nr:cobyrinate a,c-diamide synthase [Spirochaetales bacterium]
MTQNKTKGLYPRIIISAASSGSGKTLVTMGLIRAFLSQGKGVQSFKIGPDYIDTGFHHLCAKKPCYNLDTVLMGKKGVSQTLLAYSKPGVLSIIEGVMGLYDGKSPQGEGSTAEIAILTQTPVLVVLNAKAMAQTAGALALGIMKYNQQCPVAGFILNHLGSEAHYEIVKEAVEKATGLPVVGWLAKINGPLFPERHLGLVAAWEFGDSASPDHPVNRAEQISDHMQNRFDFEQIKAIAQRAGEYQSISNNKNTVPEIMIKTPKTSIALALDDAFHFYYQENLDMLEEWGIQWKAFSPIKSPDLPQGIGGIYLGGGYPENHAASLEANLNMKQAILNKAKQNMPIWAECGGLMYLASKLLIQERSYNMAGLFDLTIKMEKQLSALGYYQATLMEDTILGPAGFEATGHMFRWSQIIQEPEKPRPLFKVTKNNKTSFEGYIYKNTVASYLHLHFAGAPQIAANFLKTCRAFEKGEMP